MLEEYGISNSAYELINECEKELVDGLIYSEYINMALEELIKQGVKYVEISYSNLPIIKNIYIIYNGGV